MKNFSKVYAAELEGIDARLIEVETDIHSGLHNFTIVGLADKALSEAKERVSSALKNIDVKPPNKENRKIVVNLAPADVKKTGSHYDLSIALGYLLATKQIAAFDTSDKIFVGELSLDGQLRRTNGVLNMSRLAQKLGFKTIFVPAQNAKEAAIIQEIEVIPLNNLPELMRHLEGKNIITPQPITDLKSTPLVPPVDISDIKGQATAKRALTIAAAGGHNMFMVGPPGSGKTMLAHSLSSILPPMSLEECIEVTQIYSAASLLNNTQFINIRPFRSPHHTASPVAIIGGGANPRPGEVSLAHRGVLFLDEVPEFRRDLLETLRQPMEAGAVHVARARGNLIFPAKFTLVAAMNPCPCGYYGDPEKECRCNAYEVIKYQKKISGPLLDRIDLQIHVPRVPVNSLRGAINDAKTEDIRGKIEAARAMQKQRFANVKTKGKTIFLNAEMTSKECEAMLNADSSAKNFIDNFLQKEHLSARAFYRILKTARTIADLCGAECVSEDHVAEAFQYRLREK